MQSTISSSASSASVSGIPYMVNGKINEISISVDSVSGYSAKTGTASSNRGRYAYVSFTKNEILIGEPAKKQINSNLENTIFGAKRFIQQEIYEKEITEYKKYCPLGKPPEIYGI